VSKSLPSALLWVFLLFASTNALAQQTRYCVTSINQCFESLGAAEAAMRGLLGTPCLQRDGEIINMSDTTSRIDYVCKRGFEETSASYYSHSVCDDLGAPDPAQPWRRYCASEGEVAAKIVASMQGGYCIRNTRFEGGHVDPYQVVTGVSNVPGMGFTLFGWDGCVPSSQHRRFVAEISSKINGVCSGTWTQWFNTVLRVQAARCPARSTAQTNYITSSVLTQNASCASQPRSKESEICVGPRDSITIYKSPQYPSCPKSGNPCVPGTGAKELSHQVLSGGIPLQLHYLSISEAPAKGGLGPNWRHSFSTRIVNPAQSGPLNFVVANAQGYLENYAYVSTGIYRSTNEAGAVLKKIGTVFELIDASRTLRFNAKGLLTDIEHFARPESSYVLSYDANDRLQTVANQLSRSLSFQYAVSGALISITGSDGAIAQLTTAAAGGNLSAVLAPGQTTARQFLYENTTWPDRVTGINDETGLRLSTYAYQASTGRVIDSQLANGVYRHQLTYPTTTTTVVTSPLGLNTTYTFGGPGGYQRMLSAVDSSGTLTQSYGFGDRFTATVDRRGSRTEHAYADGIRRSLTIEAKDSPSERITEFTWDGALNRLTERRVCAANTPNTCPTTAVTPNLLSKTLMTYNTRGQLLSTTQIDPANASNTRISSSTYCDVINTTTCPLIGLKLTDNGPRTDVTDITTYAYRMADAADLSYRKGDLWKITNANAHVVEYLAYDGAGRVLKMKDPNGVETWMSYHPRGWLLSRTVKGTTAALDAITSFVYTPFGAIERVTQPDGSYTQYSYDQAQRLIAINDGLNNRIDYTLDAAGNRTNEATRDSGNVLKRNLAREYDQLSRLRASLRAGVLTTDPISKKTSYTYDANGNQELMTDPMIGTTAGTVSDNDYDPLNRLIKTLQDVGGINAKVEYQYDALDRLTTVKDPKNLNTVYSYDGLGNQISLNSPDTGVTSFTYDTAGNRTSQTDARGVVSNMTYDVLNRLLTISYPSDTSKNVSFTYDANQSGCASDENRGLGRLTHMADATGSTKLCYDYLGQVRRKIQMSGGQTLTMQYRYDLAGRLNSLTYPSGAIVNYTRDSQGRLLTAVLELDTTSVLLVTNASYLPFGPLSQLNFGNGQVLSKAYDLNYDIDAITGGLSLDFSVDEVGNIRQIQSGTATQKYGYDKLYRLQDVRDQNQSLIEAFTYDATGNRLTQQDPGGTESYSYPATNHRLTQLGPVVRTQDAVGNTLTGIPGFGSDAASYDVRNRLSGVGVNRYKANFNARGERVLKGAQSAVAADWVNPGLTATLYDESGQVLSYRRSGSTVTHEEIVWFGNTPIARFTSSGTTITAVHTIHTDHLNSPRALANARTQGGQAAGITVWSWDLIGANASGSNAFGSIAANEDVDLNGTSVKFDLRFPGQQYDSETNLNYNYFRDFESGTGRYVESDPIGQKGNINTYSYVESWVLRMIDEKGLASCPGGYVAQRSPNEKDGSTFCARRIYCTDLICLKSCADGRNRCELWSDPSFFIPAAAIASIVAICTGGGATVAGAGTYGGAAVGVGVEAGAGLAGASLARCPEADCDEKCKYLCGEKKFKL
jgi:RHS repeat-associated protein